MSERTTLRVCTDANFVLKLVVKEDGSQRVRDLWTSWTSNDVEVVAPSLLWYESTATLRKHVYRGTLSQREAEEALSALFRLRLSTVYSADMHRVAWEIATRLGEPTAYDAHYLAVAQQFGCPFWTADKRLYHAARSLLPDTHLISAG
jgi:predicted nucleic acid-binding protein